MTRTLTVLPTKQVIHLATEFVYPPIPIRSNDWAAVDANTYDADFDGDSFVSTSPCGRGETEQQAIDDLLDQIEERAA